MAAWLAWFKASVRQPTNWAPKVSKACAMSSHLHVLFTAVRCQRWAIQV